MAVPSSPQGPRQRRGTAIELAWPGKGEHVLRDPETGKWEFCGNDAIVPRPLIELETFGDEQRRAFDPERSNLLIQGENLYALRALLPYFAGKVKCIYIDPPFNTGQDFDAYDDNFQHSVWLSMMRERLEILRRLLAEDGSIWTNLDDNEAHYCKVLCDEVFGRSNFVATVVWQKKHTRANDARWLSDNHDFIFCAAKNKSLWKRNLLPREGGYSGYNNPDNDPRGSWASGPCHAKTPNPKDIYEIKTPSGRKLMPPAGTSWRFSKEKFKELITENRIYFGITGANVPRYKRFRTEVQEGLVPTTLWLREEVGDNQDAKAEVKAFNPGDVFSTPKPEKLMHRIVEIATNPGDWILDSFAGSGTTGAVAHKMGRRWIMVESGEHCRTHIIPRLKKIIDGQDGAGITEAVGWKGGGGFRFLEVGAPLVIQHPEIKMPVMNPKYTNGPLTRAVCATEGFLLTGDKWLQGRNGDHWAHVTEEMVDAALVARLGRKLPEGHALTVYALKVDRRIRLPPHVAVKRMNKDFVEPYLKGGA